MEVYLDLDIKCGEKMSIGEALEEHRTEQIDFYNKVNFVNHADDYKEMKSAMLLNEYIISLIVKDVRKREGIK